MTLNTADQAGKELLNHRKRSNRAFLGLIALLLIAINIIAFTLYQSGSEKVALKAANKRADDALTQDSIIRAERNRMITTAAAAPSGSEAQKEALGQLVQSVKVPLPGRDGTNGVNGSKGNTGNVGAIGVAGPIGETGAVGHIGPKGDTGATGSAGTQGLVGIAGTIGVTGPVGPAGLTGTIGLTGAVGATGATGATGSVGITGATGAAGTNAVFPITLYCTRLTSTDLILTCTATMPTIVPTPSLTPTPEAS